MRVRVYGAVSDLNAADACYHKSCCALFMSLRSKSGAPREKQEDDEDQSLQIVVSSLNEDQSKIWNSVDIHTLYADNGGIELSCRLLVARLLEYFGDNLVAQGIAIILG